MLQTFSFVQGDLNSYRPRSDFSSPTPLADLSRLDDPNPADELRFPKSMYIIYPLISAYELNPVAANAQASVPVPEGLDLDSWIMPPPREVVPDIRADEGGDGTEKRKKKSKKGKDKAVELSITGKKKVKGNGAQVVLAPLNGDETPEERVDRERVCFSLLAIDASD